MKNSQRRHWPHVIPLAVPAPHAHDGRLPETNDRLAAFNAVTFKGRPVKNSTMALVTIRHVFLNFVKKVVSIDPKPCDWSTDVKATKKPVFMAVGGGEQGEFHGPPKSRPFCRAPLIQLRSCSGRIG